MCPAMEIAFLNDDVVYWPYAGVDRDNEEQVLSGYHIYGRWDPDLRQMRDSTGKLVNIDVQLIVAQEGIVIGSIMWLGLVQDLPTPVTNVTNLFKVIAVQETHDIRHIPGVLERQLGLVRYKNTLPNIVGVS
jgi:hypothetical protein